jgi:CAP-Gly domain-containing linker protein 1
MNQELQKENSAYGTKIRTLEAENKALMTEVEDLKESIKNLEQAMDESILREERMLEEEQNGGATGDSSVTQRALKESRSELEQLRKKLSELEKKSAKTISELNKEVADLESLVEAKIYREDDLEREVERLKDKVQRLQSKSSSKSTSGGDALGKSTSNRGNHTRSSTVTQQTVTKEEPVHTSAVCEICEQAGHDIFSCPLLKDDESSTVKSPSADMYCVDCDSRTHNSEFIILVGNAILTNLQPRIVHTLKMYSDPISLHSVFKVVLLRVLSTSCNIIPFSTIHRSLFTI